MNKAWLAASAEARIMEYCETSAHQIIAELETSGGDHGEDIGQLYRLIEGWQHLRHAHRYDMQQAEIYGHREQAS